MDSKTILSLTALLLFVACAKTPPPGEFADEVCDVAKSGKRVAVTGYLNPPGIIIGCEQTCLFYVSHKKGPYEGLGFHVPVGIGNGLMEPLPKPDRITRRAGAVQSINTSSITLRDSSGKTFGIGDWIRVQGELQVSQSGDKVSCRLQVHQLEALE